jgi:hypothetical protein
MTASQRAMATAVIYPEPADVGQNSAKKKPKASSGPEPASTGRLLRAHEMRRVDLVEATMQGWTRLDPQQRERFFQAGLKAALRLDRLELRAWLLRRLRNAPLAESIDPARFAISDDMAALLKAMPLRADDADRGTGL